MISIEIMEIKLNIHKKSNLKKKRIQTIKVFYRQDI